MIPEIITDVHLLYLTILVFALDEDLLKEIVVVLLHLLVSHSLASHVTSISSLGRVLWVDVKILEDDGLAESGFVMDPTASVTVTTGSYLEIKTAVYFVLLSSEDGSKILGHVDQTRETLLDQEVERVKPLL